MILLTIIAEAADQGAQYAETGILTLALGTMVWLIRDAIAKITQRLDQLVGRIDGLTSEIKKHADAQQALNDRVDRHISDGTLHNQR